MLRFNKASLLLLLFLTCSVSPARATDPPAKQVDLCSVVKRPAEYLHQRISFEADVLADGMHGSVLIAPKCDLGIFPDFGKAKAAGDEYGKAIFSGGPGTINKDIHARFTGVFRIGSLSWPMCGQRHTCNILQVDSMTNLKIVFKPGHEPITPPDATFPVKIAKPESPAHLPPK